MSVASKKNVLAYVLALTVVIGALFTLRHRISFFNSSSVTIALDQLTESQAAAQKYFELAKDGDALAMNALGLMYAQGQIGKIDGQVNYAKAFSFFKKSADKGNSDAQNSIGSLFISGVYGKVGDKVDVDSALEYFQLSANQDNLEGLNNLATLYRSGNVGTIEGKPNYQKIAELYNRQIELKDSRGYINLATLYIKGEGVEKDVTRGVELLDAAIKANNPAASRLMGELYLAGLISKEPNYEKAASHYKDAINGGDSSAMVNLGSLYMSGKFGKVDNRPNFEAALDLYRKAVQNNNPAGLTNIAAMYYSGILVEEGKSGEEIAKQLWTQAAAMGDTGAKRNLEILERKKVEVAANDTTSMPAMPDDSSTQGSSAETPAPAPESTPAPSADNMPAATPDAAPQPAATPSDAPAPTAAEQPADNKPSAAPQTTPSNAKADKYSKLNKASNKKAIAKAERESNLEKR